MELEVIHAKLQSAVINNYYSIEDPKHGTGHHCIAEVDKRIIKKTLQSH